MQPPPSTAAEIERRMTFAEHGTIMGVEVTPSGVWFASDTGQLVQVDPTTGTVRHRLDNLSPCAGTAFDGEGLWQIEADRIVRVNPETGETLGSIPRPANVHCSGMAYAEGFLWVGDHDGQRILKLDPANGNILRVIQTDRFVTGVTFDGDRLAHGTWTKVEGDRQPTIRVIDTSTGTVHHEVTLPEDLPLTGVSRDSSGRYWCGGGESGELLVVRPPKP